jgi:type I restriction enzyme M protein
MEHGRAQVAEARSGGIGSAAPLAELTPLQTLVPIFERIRAFAAANGYTITRDEAILEELSKLLHAKVFDEVEAERGRPLRFRTDPDEPDQLIAHRIAGLYEEASLESVSGVEKIRLDETTCAYAVRQLEPWRLTGAGRDVVGEAYESLIFPALRGGQGQFFTPQNVARLMAALADPPANARVIDPACGTGGFLIEVARLASGGRSQFNGKISADGDTIEGLWKLSRDDSTWDDDLAITFRRR